MAHDYGQASISYGGATGEFGVNIKLTGGDACQDLVDYLRRSFPVHRPSRIDVCADFQGPTAWEDLKDLLIQTANHYDVPLSTFGDWVNGKNGRTLYVNPRKRANRPLHTRPVSMKKATRCAQWAKFLTPPGLGPP